MKKPCINQLPTTLVVDRVFCGMKFPTRLGAGYFINPLCADSYKQTRISLKKYSSYFLSGSFCLVPPWCVRIVPLFSNDRRTLAGYFGRITWS